MNPLKRQQQELLERIGCADLARKIQEIIDRLNLLDWPSEEEKHPLYVKNFNELPEKVQPSENKKLCWCGHPKKSHFFPDTKSSLINNLIEWVNCKHCFCKEYIDI